MRGLGGPEGLTGAGGVPLNGASGANHDPDLERVNFVVAVVAALEVPSVSGDLNRDLGDDGRVCVWE